MRKIIKPELSPYPHLAFTPALLLPKEYFSTGLCPTKNILQRTSMNNTDQDYTKIDLPDTHYDDVRKTVIEPEFIPYAQRNGRWRPVMGLLFIGFISVLMMLSFFADSKSLRLYRRRITGEIPEISTPEVKYVILLQTSPQDASIRTRFRTELKNLLNLGILSSEYSLHFDVLIHNDDNTPIQTEIDTYHDMVLLESSSEDQILQKVAKYCRKVAPNAEAIITITEAHKYRDLSSIIMEAEKNMQK